MYGSVLRRCSTQALDGARAGVGLEAEALLPGLAFRRQNRTQEGTTDR